MSELKAALRTLTDLEFLVGQWNGARRDEQRARAALAQTIDTLPPALAAPLRAMIFGEEAATDPASAPAIAGTCESTEAPEQAAGDEGTASTERAGTEAAEVRESAVLIEPADPDESAVLLEPADSAESTEHQEPAARADGDGDSEPAAGMECTGVPEPAMERESAGSAERASAGESADGQEPAEIRESAEATERDDPWISLQAYATLNGVSEPVVYAACVKGKIYGDAYRLGPPKRVRAHLADEQIMAAGDATFLRQKVMARLGRAKVPVSAPSDDELLPPRLTAAEAVNAMRARQYEVLTGRKLDTWVVNGKLQSTAKVMKRAQDIVDREWRLARARRKERAA